MAAINSPYRSPETSLYLAVKQHLERLGYEAKGEVCGCDIVAVRPGERLSTAEQNQASVAV